MRGRDPEAPARRCPYSLKSSQRDSLTEFELRLSGRYTTCPSRDDGVREATNGARATAQRMDPTVDSLQ